MNDCYWCGSPFSERTASEEHIIPSALGGRLSSIDLLCKPCNDWFGHDVEPALIAQLTFFMTRFKLELPRRKKVPKALVQIEGTGEQMLLRPDGYLEALKTKVVVRPDGKKDLTSPSPRDFVKALKGFRKKNDQLDAVIANPTTARIAIPYPDHRFPLWFDTATDRAIAKIAAEYWIHAGGERRFVDRLRPAIEGSEGLPPLKLFYPDVGPVLNRPSRYLGHVLAARTDPNLRMAVVYVELFSAVRFIVPVSFEYDGPAVRATYGYDLLTQRSWIPSVWLGPLTQINFNWTYPVENERLRAECESVIQFAPPRPTTPPVF